MPEESDRFLRSVCQENYFTMEWGLKSCSAGRSVGYSSLFACLLRLDGPNFVTRKLEGVLGNFAQGYIIPTGWVATTLWHFLALPCLDGGIGYSAVQSQRAVTIFGCSIAHWLIYLLADGWPQCICKGAMANIRKAKKRSKNTGNITQMIPVL